MLKYLTFLLLLIGCKWHKKASIEKTEEINIGSIKMTMPSSSKFIHANGIDSYVVYIVNSNNDTFNIEYGPHKIIYDLFDYPPVAIPLKDKEIMKRANKLPAPDEAIFSKTPEEDNLQNIFQKEFYMYDTINGIVAKVVQPKIIGNGKTGLYISELKDGNAFSIYAENLDSTNHRNALQMFKTISYK